jgi:hypothetical protein
MTPVDGASTAGERAATGPYTLAAGIDEMTAVDQALPAAIDPIVGQDQPGTTLTGADCFPGSPGQAVCTLNYSNSMSQLQTINLSADGQSFSLRASFDPPTT